MSWGIYLGVTWVSSTGEQMSSSPFSLSSCPTYGMDNSTLQSEGWIDATATTGFLFVLCGTPTSG